MTKQGVEIDHCPSCKGIWLDRGEIYYFAKNTKPLIKELKRAEKNAREGELLSPKTGKPMLEMRLFDRVEVDQCTDTDGLWLDKGELQQVLAGTDAKLRLALDPAVAPAAAPAPAQEIAPEKLTAYAAGAKRLPNLGIRSASSLILLYALLGALLIAAVELAEFPPEFAVGIGIVIALIQFLIGPWMMDLSLRWFYQASWVTPDQLPDHLREFVQRVCNKRKMKFPRMGIIHDGAPNAFTYGHHPNNARIVITQGLFDLLDEKEVEAVVAHEIGHAAHWDMLVMTIAYLVPLIAYYVYRTLIRIRSRGRDRSAGYRIAIAVGAYVVYIISQYIVLWLSRTREYRADHFAGEATGDPSTLASALVKIGYGLAGQEKAKKSKDQESSRRPRMEAIGALGIFDSGSARAFAVSSVSAGGGTSLDPEHLKGAMRWDMWNPWAKFYEFNSTHPLIASRLDYLGRQAAGMGLQPLVVFDEKKPESYWDESYWDEFFVDVLVMFLPWILALGLLMAGIAQDDPRLMVLAVTGLGVGMLLKTLFSYRGGVFPRLTVAGLLKKVKVSAVRGVPCTIHGQVIGRGVPGLIWSEDFVITSS
jgi:Zn-dependent protease with chaperone function/Zn-finger nucleic acid-binding protein